MTDLAKNIISGASAAAEEQYAASPESLTISAVDDCGLLLSSPDCLFVAKLYCSPLYLFVSKPPLTMSDYELEEEQDPASVSVQMVDVPFDDEEEEEEEKPKSPKDIAYKMLSVAETEKKTLYYGALTPASLANMYKLLKDFQNRIHSIIPGAHGLHKLGSFYQMEEAITSIFYSVSVAKGLQTMVELSYLAISIASILKVPLFGDSKATEQVHLLTRKFVLFPEYASSPEELSNFYFLFAVAYRLQDEDGNNLRKVMDPKKLAEIDQELINHLCNPKKGDFPFEDVFPDVAYQTVLWESSNTLNKMKEEGQDGLRGLSILVSLAHMEVEIPKAVKKKAKSKEATTKKKDNPKEAEPEKAESKKAETKKAEKPKQKGKGKKASVAKIPSHESKELKPFIEKTRSTDIFGGGWHVVGCLVSSVQIKNVSCSISGDFRR